MGFECCVYKKKEIHEEMMGSRDWGWGWSKMPLTCEVMFLRDVVSRKERNFDVVHVDESRAKKDMVTRAMRNVKNGNVLSLHERCSSEHKQKDVNAAKDQKEMVGLLKEVRIAGHLRGSHGGGGLEDG